MINPGLAKLFEEVKKKYEKYKDKDKEIYTPESHHFDESPPCIKQLLQGGVLELGSKNMIQYRLCAYFKSQGVIIKDCIVLMDEWAMNIRKEFTHEITHDGGVDYESIKKQNRYVVNTVYSSGSYGFSCSGIKQIPGVICDDDCKGRIESAIITTLFESDKVDMRFKRLAVDAEIVGRRDVVRIIPETITARCVGMQISDKCESCALKGAENGIKFKITSASPGILNLLEPSNVPIGGKVAALINMKRRQCSSWNWTTTEQNVETVYVSPRMTNEASTQDRYTKRLVYYLGHGIRTNQAYRLSGYTHVSDKDGDVIFVFDSAKELADSLTEFKWTDEMKKRSAIFQRGENETVNHKLNEITESLNRCITRMWGRENMIKAIDLTYHSVRRIPFQGAIIKGWLDTLIIGDSGQGKTTAFDRLAAHYNAGYIASGESARRTGLLYAVDVKSEGPPTLIWGVLPRNSGRIVVIDEAKDLIDEGGFGELTKARSQGIISVDTIASGKASCETRLIIMTNPADRRKMSSFMFPVEAIQHLVPGYEDIRRFDMAVGVMSNEIADEVIHTDILSLPEEKIKYDSRSCSDLIYFIWNLAPEKIIFPHPVQKRVLEVSLYMCRKFSSEIPLVEPADQREKLARISTAIAARTYQSDGNTLEVTEDCVNEAYDFLSELYTGPALDYLAFSSANAKMVVDDVDIEMMIKQFKEHLTWGTMWKDVTLYFQHNNYVKVPIISAALGANQQDIKTMLNWMESNSLVKTIKFGTVATANGIRFFRTLIPVDSSEDYLKSDQIKEKKGEF